MRSIIFRFLLLVFFGFGSWVKSEGQTAQETIGTVTISSPNAASLGKFGDIPVSYHTGVPQINIPIYTVEAGSLKLPISLDYHASGIKCMEPASWVGAGWALNAGGMITRTVQGQPDEAGSGGSVQQDGHFSQYGYNSYFYSGTQQDWQGFANGIKDGEPDLFFFNFGGYSGKFYFRDDRTPVLVPEQDITIIPSYSGGRSIDYFTIVTPDGTKYTFGNSPNVTGTAPIETTNAYSMKNGSMTNPPTSSWFLNQVVSADNQFTINLTYVPENYGFYTWSMFPIDGATNFILGSYGLDIVKDIIHGVRLSQISFPNGTVNFTANNLRTDLCDGNTVIAESANNSAASLDAIRITDGAGLCKNYNFSYTYFQGDNTVPPGALTAGYTFTTDETRLRLDQVTESSCDGTTAVPPYKFTYNNTGIQRRLSFGVDHWGYFNGVTANTGLIPTIYVNSVAVPGATRDPAWPNMSAGILTRIDYPTGGYNTFAFEANSALEAVTTGSYNVLGSFLFGNMDGQAGTYSGSNSFTSNGNPPVLTITTNCSFGGLFTIYDANHNSVYSITFTNYLNGQPGGSTTQYQYTLGSIINPLLPVGNYTVSASLSYGNATPIGGVVISLTQPTSVTTYQNVTLGGLRIKTVTAYDALTSNNVVTNYSYTTPGGTSTAVLYSVPTYATQIRNDIIENEGEWTVANGFVPNSLIVNGCPSAGDYIKSPGSVRPMATVQGSIIGYTMVTVSQPGNGSTVYNYYTTNSGYSNLTNASIGNSVTQGTCATTIPNFPPAPLPFDSKRGELYSEQHYDNSGRLLKDVYYAPSFNETPILSTPAFIVQIHSLNGNGMLLGTQYSLNTVKKISLTTTEDDYGATGGIVTTTKTVYYGSAFHNQPTKMQTSTSTGDMLTTTMQYAADFRLANCDAISDCSAEYNSACTSCQNTYNSARTACAGASSCITTAFLNYQQCLTTARTSYVNCRNTNYMGSSSAFSQCHVNAENSADANLKPVLQIQDNNMNPAIEKTQFKDALLQHSSFVAYAPATTPANFPYPSQTQLVNLQGVSAGFTPAAVSGSTISKDSRYLTESQYVFNAGNPQQVLPHDGVPVSYIWDYQHTQPIAKVTNAAANVIGYTSFEADGTGNWTVPPGTIITGNAFTGNSYYSFGSTPITLTGLDPTATYILSYWSNSYASYSVGGSTKITPGKLINGWTYFEHVVTGWTTTSVWGSGGIDELRLYPVNAQMTTYTYAPLIGVTSQCDVDSRATYYNYDPLGRLQYVKDQDGNIIKTYQYHYKGQ